ncbi:glycosyl hydrolase family 30 [Limosilactobacillus reuteri]|uniref:glycoside hydrolase family 30 protein n=1 Tax=Limosilactobacillus reuteri TaxID=1598 RepID=UPI001E49CD7A|nr:glycoside hydrolase family 30 beta sandwich domain-containing protein [Limosilactobacillus reuteri]MCC4383649.1 glycosyl hydrolase family 30 [Limosilactobacillus reuteri]MCC4419365.1 glycosyl hydrolase family 30 [Limosilactobacillus reuteri]
MKFKNEFWTATSGDLTEKRQKIEIPVSTKNPGTGSQIIIDPSIKKQYWISAGAAITDATASLIWKQTPEQRNSLLHELFDPNEGNFSAIRIPIGSCDFGSGEVSEEEYYSYDDVPFGKHDSNLSKFSIGEGKPGAENATKDLKYIVPVVQEILKINPAVKVLASPWSGPAWMKNTGNMKMGGHLRFGEFTGNGYATKDRLEGVYANYFIKFIEAYKKLGIPIYALTIQNEPSNAAAWPAMIWDIKELAHFGYKYLRPALDNSFPDTKLYFWDGSLNVLNEPLSKFMSIEEAKAFNGFAFHTYDGPYSNLFNASRFNPNWDLAMTERRCMLEESVDDASHIMFGLIGNWLVRQGLSSIYLWNLALDERGLPNIAGSTGRRGVITIDHRTGKVQRNLEYYMLRNFTQDVDAGSVVIRSSNYTQDGYSGGLGSVAFMGPTGSITAHIYNPTDSSLTATVKINSYDTGWQTVNVPAYGTVTLHKSNEKINESSPRKDEKFKLNPRPAALQDDWAPGKGINK